MNDQEIEKLIREKQNQINSLNREIKELRKQHSILSQRYQVAIVGTRKCKETTKGAVGLRYNEPHKTYFIPQKAFSEKRKAKDYAYQIRVKIRKGLIKLKGKKYDHMVILDKTIKGYQVVWSSSGSY